MEHHGGPIWRTVTPDGDVYPEEFAFDEDVLQIRMADDEEVPVAALGHDRYNFADGGLCG